MSVQPDTDRRLARTSRKLAGNGARLLALGAALYLIGALLLILDLSTVAGLFCIGIATPPTIAAVALLLTGGVGKRTAEGKDFV